MRTKGMCWSLGRETQLMVSCRSISRSRSDVSLDLVGLSVTSVTQGMIHKSGTEPKM